VLKPIFSRSTVPGASPAMLSGPIQVNPTSPHTEIFYCVA
jgi:hypothetical protein